MSEMNFIPASMAQLQRNKLILNNGGIAIVCCVGLLLAIYGSLFLYNQHITQENERLTSTKNELNQRLKKRDSEEKVLKKAQLVAANLDQLNSFSALTLTFEMIHQYVPDETALDTFVTEFNQNGETIVTLEGISDSHLNLTNWVSVLQSLEAVKSAELISSQSTQSTAKDELKQRFVLQITRVALDEVKS